MTRAPLAVVLLAVVPLVACGGSEPEPDPSWRFLEVGVEPRAEADELQGSLERSGWSLERRVDGETFVAQTFVDPETGQSSARVVTKRGIVLAIDVPPAEAAQPIRVLAPPGGDNDLDGDGNEEVVLARHDPVYDRTCLGMMRVIRSEGFLHPVPEELDGLGGAPCLEELEDLDGDGVLEGIAVLRLPELSRGAVPSVPVLLELRDGGWRPSHGHPGFWERERARLAEETAAARTARDVDRAYVLAVEGAALERAAGGSRRAQVVAFDDALGGFVLTRGQADAIARARAFIAGGWQAP